MCDFFEQSIITIKGVGQKRAQLFGKLGVDSVGALLRFYPRRYEDWSCPTTVAEGVGSEAPFIRARVLSGVTEHRIRSGMTVYKCRAADADGTRLNLTFFNNPYVKRMLSYDTDYVFHGRLTFSGSFAEMSSPVFRPAGAEGERLIPVYAQTEGLSSRIIEQTVRLALDSLPDPVPDMLPERLRREQGLLGLGEALRCIHQPRNGQEVEAARQRFIFEEFFLFQLGLFRLKGGQRTGNAPAVSDFSGELLRLLPFEPTGAQKRAIAECQHDMQHGGRPMARLLQGDVGSGKTVVAAALCVSAAHCGLQAALMAPTEILAEQHFKTLSGILEKTDVRVVLLTGAVTGVRRREALTSIADGTASIVVGTHALITEDIKFASLGLVITDEQHRFGVAQRAALSAKGNDPHMLVMSATPIPRTLALMMFGDLEVSVLDEMPAGRSPVRTLWIDTGKRERAYGFIKKHLDEGFQAYVVCPLVEDSESETLVSAESYSAELAIKDFAGYRVGTLHGRMRPADKEYVMRRFSEGELDLLVSTTVIEVGVDVPNAVIMLIENADRFGLSQLHQLRGRVGRGKAQSYCILVSDAKGEAAVSRMKTMVETTDGFKISEQDLRLRGPGDFFGMRQHGLPALKVADFESDLIQLSAAQSAVRTLLESDPKLEKTEHKLLRKAVDELYAQTLF